METRHRAEVRGQSFALACLKLLNEVVHGLLDELLCGVVFLATALLIRRLAAVPPRRIFPVRRGVADMAVPLLAAKAVLLIVVGMTLFLICCPLWGDLRA